MDTLTLSWLKPLVASAFGDHLEIEELLQHAVRIGLCLDEMGTLAEDILGAPSPALTFEAHYHVLVFPCYSLSTTSS